MSARRGRSPRSLGPVASGKLSERALRGAVLPFLGRARAEVAVRPSPGLDFGGVRLRGGRSLLLTTDPLYVDPSLGWKDATWFAFHILATDLVTSGWAPQYASVDLNLPVHASDREVRALMAGFSEAADDVGTAIVAGHTGRYEGCAYPFVGGASLFAVVPSDGYVTPAMARPGDRVLVSKVPALESAVLLARRFPDRVEATLGKGTLQAARRSFRHLTTVPEALACARMGLRGQGVWAMHDVAEGGLHQALVEISEASGCGLDLDLSRLPASPWASSILREFGVDELSGSGGGGLVVAADPEAAPRVLQAWRRSGTLGADIGAFRREPGLRERGRALGPPRPDGFWPAVERARSRQARRRT